MDNYKFTVGIEPTDEYKKAKLDFLQAMESISKLTDSQKQKLLEELYGATNVAIMYSIFKKHFGWGEIHDRRF